MNECKECGMVLDSPAEYHTFTYCELMKRLRNGRSVRDNIEFTVANHPKFKALETKVSDLKAKLVNQREFLKYVAGQSKEALAIIEREGFVFDHSGGRWEKLAFTLYSDLVAISTDARHRLEEMEENNDERWKV